MSAPVINLFGAVIGMVPFAGAQNANAVPGKERHRTERTITLSAKMYDVTPIIASPMSLAEGRLDVTPAMARQIVASLKYEGQRPAYQHHVALLSDAMQRGQWTAGSQIAFGRMPDGSLHLVNGQHRLLAVVDSGTTQNFQVMMANVGTETELAALYNRFDFVARDRSLSEVLNAAGIANQYGLSKTAAKSAYEAVGLLENGLRQANYQHDPVKARSTDVRFEAARPWWKHAVKYEELIKPARAALRSRLMMAGTVAVALATLRYQADKAEPFWSGLAENDGLARNDPRHTLIQTLIERDMSKGNQAGRVIIPATAWNAWFQDRKISVIKVFPDAEPRLLGTPYDGRKWGPQ